MKKKVKLKLKKDRKDIRLHLTRKINHVKYRIYNPGGNKTALIINKNYSKEEIKCINNFILNKYKYVEQVGFIRTDKFELEMAGGEFCVNATRCAIWRYLKGKDGTIKIKVSGMKETIEGGIKGKNVYANIPIRKESSEIIRVIKGYKIVNLDGISFAVLEEKDSKEYLKLKEKEIKKRCKNILNKVNLKKDAVGIILQKKEQIYPVIWVKSINTLYLETACGSGSLAMAIIKNQKENKRKFKILQPSGSYLKIELKIKNNVLISAIVSGEMEE